MLIGVKFCGGCNEGYDRAAAFEAIRDHFSGRADFEYADENMTYDALLLLSGCTNRCASIDQYKFDNKLVSIWKQDKIKDAIKEIEDYLHEGG